MKQLKRLAVHIVLLLIAAGWAFVESDPSKDDAKPLEPGEVQLWKGKPEQVSLVRYVAKRKIVTLEQKKDAEGAYFLGKIEPVVEAKADEAAEEKPKADDKKPKGHPVSKPKPVEPVTFVSVRNGKKIIDKLASLRAKLSVGEVSPEREEEFGLDKPEGTLTVTVAGKSHELVVGKATPGSGNRYVRDSATKRVFVIEASFVRDLGGGATRLRESAMHGWKTTDVASATIKAGDQQRVIVRAGTEGRRFWADPSDKDRNDETAGNWLSKLDRLRPNGYLEALPDGAKQVLRVDYSSEKNAIGFVEIFKQSADPADAKAKDVYFAKSEQTRLYVKVGKTFAEQVADDVVSVLSGDSGPAASASAAASAPAASAAPPAAPLAPPVVPGPSARPANPSHPSTPHKHH